MNVVRQTTCMFFNRIMLVDFASLFDCTTVSRISDGMLDPSLICYRRFASDY